MKARYRFAAFSAACLCVLSSATSLAQTNYLEPPGKPGSEAARMKTLNQVEPRTVISSLPYDITNSGSYYVSGQLCGCANSNGISVYTNHVRIDLCGFPILGGPGSLSGVYVAVPAANISVKNGIVSGWGRFGIDATNSKDVVFADLKAFQNGYGGLYAGENAMVERCSAYNNGYDPNAQGQLPPLNEGIQVGPFSTVLDCKSRFNKGAGIHAFDFSRISGCTATESSSSAGIVGQDFCTIRDCTAAKNGLHGIFVRHKGRVIGNTSVFNSTATNDAAGIMVQGNNNLIEENIVISNSNGIFVAAGGNLILRNAASQNVIMDYNVTSQSTKGRVLNAIDGQTFYIQGNDIVTNNPWANFRF